MEALAPGDVVITPAVDRLSRDATDLLVIARDMQRAGAGLRSIAEPVVDRGQRTICPKSYANGVGRGTQTA